MLTLLGGREPLRAGCRLDHASIERSVVTAAYRCPAGEVEVELRHASAAPPAAVIAESFAISSRDPAARTTGLLEDIAGRVRSHGAAIRWTRAVRDRRRETGSAGGSAGTDPGRLVAWPGRATPRVGIPARETWVGTLLLGIVVAVWRRARRGIPRRGGTAPTQG